MTLPLILVAYGVSSGSLFEAKTLGLAVGPPRGSSPGIALWRASKALSRERLLGMGA